MNNTTYWLLGLGAVSLVGWWLRQAGTPRDQVSSAWVREQIRARGVTGWSGAYHED